MNKMKTVEQYECFFSTFFFSYKTIAAQQVIKLPVVENANES